MQSRGKTTPSIGCPTGARGGIDEIARHHALVLSAERHGCFAREDSRADAQVGVERWHARDQLECGPDGTLGVVLPRDRCPPDSHHGVADELLHRTRYRSMVRRAISK